MKHVVAGASGLLFGLGLILSGMIDPLKVQGFLDVAGTWDPSLAFVMAGAAAVAAVLFRLGNRRSGPSPGRPGGMPLAGPIDANLVVGSLLFGVGWGISGMCPGPALAGLGAGFLPSTVFVICMLFGMETHAWLSGAPDEGP